jgi:hypothetical protein
MFGLVNGEIYQERQALYRFCLSLYADRYD